MSWRTLGCFLKSVVGSWPRRSTATWKRRRGAPLGSPKGGSPAAPRPNPGVRSIWFRWRMVEGPRTFITCAPSRLAKTCKLEVEGLGSETMARKADYGRGHPEFLAYAKFIAEHHAYKGMPDAYLESG